MKDNESVVTAKKYMTYKQEMGHFGKFQPPKIILVCYQQAILLYLMQNIRKLGLASHFPIFTISTMVILVFSAVGEWVHRLWQPN